ncbi:MAG: glycerol-3-phosphate 1-O-acyltransferase PlsY [Candidatus Fimadaptatus sp.]|jgi:glycerol-3-phosphate acyltransferase PlsY
MLKMILAVVIGYALGNISTGLIISKMVNGMDIRKAGSGNAGATNVLRTLGWLPSLLTFLGDAVKGVLAALIGMWLGGEHGALLGGLASIVGHNWPVAFGFKGGKGISTSFGVILVVQPYNAPWLLLAMAVALYFTRTVSVGSICAALLYLILNVFESMLTNMPMFLFSVAVVVLAIFQHRANIGRLIKHNENALDFKKIQRWKKN